MSEALLFDKQWSFHHGRALQQVRTGNVFQLSLFSSFHVSYVPWACVCMLVVSLTRFLWFGPYPASSAFSVQSTTKQSFWFGRILPTYFVGIKKKKMKKIFFHRWKWYGRQWHTDITSVCHWKRSDASQEDPRGRLRRHLQRRLSQTESQDAESWRRRTEGEGKRYNSKDDCSMHFKLHLFVNSLFVKLMPRVSQVPSQCCLSNLHFETRLPSWGIICSICHI